MSATSKIDWLTLADEWEKFVGYVDEKYVANDRYIRQEVESAMEEFIDRDDFAGLEERIDRLVRAAGRRPRDVSENKMVFTDAIAEGEKTRVTIHVFADILKQFKIQAKEQSDHNLGVVFSLALREYRQGGRSDRLEEKLDRVIDDAEGLLSELSDDSELSIRQKRTIAVSREITESMPWFEAGSDPLARRDIHQAIETVTGSDTEYMHEQYTERVVENLEYEPSPDNPDLFIPSERLKEQLEEAAEAEAKAELMALDQATPARTDGVSGSY